jgi:transcriptional regulator with XRE-family HTH domain
MKAQPKIREALRRQKLTQRELARRAGVTEAAISHILSATGNPTVRTLARIADAMNCQLRIRLVAKEMSEGERCWSLAA